MKGCYNRESKNTTGIMVSHLIPQYILTIEVSYCNGSYKGQLVVYLCII